VKIQTLRALIPECETAVPPIGTVALLSPHVPSNVSLTSARSAVPAGTPVVRISGDDDEPAASLGSTRAPP
jgi:hypothetical protein